VRLGSSSSDSQGDRFARPDMVQLGTCFTRNFSPRFINFTPLGLAAENRGAPSRRDEFSWSTPECNARYETPVRRHTAGLAA